MNECKLIPLNSEELNLIKFCLDYRLDYLELWKRQILATGKDPSIVENYIKELTPVWNKVVNEMF